MKALPILLSTTAVFGQVDYAQSTAHRLEIRAIRADVADKPPVAQTLVSLIHSMTGASYGRLATDRNGRVLLNLPSELRDVGNLRVAAENSQDLVVYQPAAGALPARALFETHSLTLELVPKRSALLSSPTQIRAWIEEGMKAKLENRSLRADRTSLKAAMAKQQEEFRRRWSDATGFTPKEIVEMALGYAKKIQDDPQGSSLLDQAVAAYAQENFQESARLFGKAADEAEVEFQRSQNRAQEIKTELDKAVRESLDALVNTRRRQAAAHRSAFEFEKATGALSAALEQIDRTRYRSLWITVFSERAEARMDEGTAGSGPSARQATETAIRELKQLLAELDKVKDDELWADTQDDLGNALREQASRVNGTAALELLAQSVAALHAADKIYDDDAVLAFDSVDAHVEAIRDLGIALKDQANRSEGSAALVLYAEAVAAFRHALKEYALDPPNENQYLARVQLHLGAALIDQANHSSGAAATQLYDQGMAAYRSALEIYTRAAFPGEWADTQRLIGNLLVVRAGQKGEKAPVNLLVQAVSACRASLEVATRKRFSVIWALSQEALGFALAQQARYTIGGGTEDLLPQAADAYRAALEVHTREQWPQEWASTQINLSTVLIDQASPLHLDAAPRLLTQAADANRAALEVYTRDADPRNWALAQNNLGFALYRQAGYSDAAVDLWNQAVAAFRASLEVRTREVFPVDWALTQNNLGLALGALARGSTGTVALEFAAQAAAAYRAALQVRTREAFPQDWAATQKNLGRVLEFATDWQPAADALEQELELYPQDRESIADLVGIYHDYLFNYERAFALQQRNVEIGSQGYLPPLERLSFAEASLTAARFERCVEILSTLTEKELIPAFIPMRDSFRFACQVGEGDVRGAILTAQTLLEAGPPLKIYVWSFKGTEHFLSTHTAFRDHRDAWVALFRALVSDDGTAFAASVRQLQDALQHR